MTSLIHVLVSASLLAGCATAAPKEPLLPLTTTLAPAAAVPFGAATLVYQGAVDSRCPKFVMCIRAGEIAYPFILKGPAGTESFNLTHAAPVHAASTVRGLLVTLVKAPEPPVGLASAPQPVIAVNVTLSRP